MIGRYMLLLLLALGLLLPGTLAAQEGETLPSRTYTDPLTDYRFEYPLSWTFERLDDGSMQMVYLREDLGLNSPPLLRFRIASYPAAATGDMAQLLMQFFQEFVGVSVAAEDIVSDDFAGLAGARYLLENEGNISMMQMVRLTDTIVLAVQTSNPIPSAEWEQYFRDFLGMMASLDASTVSLPTAAITLSLPEGWEMQETNLLTTEAAAPNLQNPEVVVRFTAGRPATILEGALGLTTAAGDSPLEVLESFVAQSQANGRIFTQTATPVSALGFEGAQIIFPEEGSVFELTLLDAGDNFYVLILTSYVTEAAIARYADEVEQLIAGAEYEAPRPGVVD